MKVAPTIIPILHNIRSCHNVGSILRTAEGFGIKNVIISGYTPRPHDPSLLPHLRTKLDHDIHKTALGAEDMLEIYSPHDIITEIQKLKSTGYQIVGLENNITASPLYKLNDPVLKTTLSPHIALVLGEEVHGIPNSLHDIIDLFVEIPMRGQKESFNVSVATAIALYAIIYS